MFFFFFNICAKYTKTLFWQAGIDKKLTKCNINGIIIKILMKGLDNYDGKK